jgi:hypothetical protein
MKFDRQKRALLLVSLALFASCETMPDEESQARAGMAARIQTEPRGDYFIGRRYFKPNFHFWGYIRRPGQAWSTAQLVILNENQKLAPDREQLNIGSDNNYEYQLRGHLSGDKVYELVSNQFYPEFVLQDYKILSTNPPPIFKSQFQPSNHKASEIEKPE